MEHVTLEHAKDHLEDLVMRAARGEDVHIDVPHLGTVTLSRSPDSDALQSVRRKPRLLGQSAGQVIVPDRLFDPLPEDELRLWTGEAT